MELAPFYETIKRITSDLVCFYSLFLAHVPAHALNRNKDAKVLSCLFLEVV